MSFARLSKKITTFISRFFLARVVFWSSGFYQFVAESSNVALRAVASGSRPSAWFVIVGREDYFESVCDYPVGDLSDVKRILEQDVYQKPFQGEIFQSIKRLSGQAHRVNTWVIKEAVFAHLGSRPLFLVPESACIDAVESSPSILIERLGKKVLVVKSINGLTSGYVGDDSSLEQFELIQRQLLSHSGVNAAQSIVEYGSKRTHSALFRGMLKVVLREPATFFRKPDLTAFATYDWLRGFKLTIMAVIVYVIVTSAYLMSSNYWIKQRLADLAEPVSHAMSVKLSVDKLTSKLSDIQSVFLSMQPSWKIWDIELDLVAQGVKVIKTISNGSGITYFLEAESATEVLTYLSQDQRVAEAEFLNQVRRINDRDIFAIKLSLVYEPILADSRELEEQTANE